MKTRKLVSIVIVAILSILFANIAYATDTDWDSSCEFQKIVDNIPLKNSSSLEFFETEHDSENFYDGDEIQSTSYNSPLWGKRILFIGDSLQTGYELPTYAISWNARITNKYQMSATNIAISGSTMCSSGKIAYAWNSGGCYEPICMRSLPNQEYDVVLVDGGGNDWYNGLPIGTNLNSRKTTELMGAINTLIDRLETKYPNALIIYMNAWENNDFRNCLGFYGDDYSKATIDVCKNRDILCLSTHLRSVSEIKAMDAAFRTTYFLTSSDRWHLNAQGHELFAPVMASLLEKQLTYAAGFAGGFYDVPKTAWFATAVEEVKDMGIMSGTSTHRFSPNAATTRAQFVTVLYRAAGSPDVSNMSCPFTDVTKTAYYYNAVVWGYNNGIVGGTSKTTFSPNGSLTRQQLVTFLYRYSKDSAPDSYGLAERYRDWPNVATYARGPISWALEKGILAGTGNNTLSPNSIATRAQMAAMLVRYLNCREV